MQDGTVLAAIDLGSNSFRLQLGTCEQGELSRTDYYKETVRQGQLDAQQQITPAAFRQGIECLTRFSERLRGLDRQQVRVVATQTLREAKNRQSFIEAAQAVLGFPIEVISGREEARLIFSGCTHLLPQSDVARLVIDIGGRSTEVVRGMHHEANEMESYQIGSVGLSQQHFADGHLSTQALALGKLAAMSVLEEIPQRFAEFRGLDSEIYGSSGTFGAICDILDAAHGSPSDLPDQRVITREGLGWIKSRMVRAGHVDTLQFESLKEDRRPVLPGGICVVDAILELLSIDQIVLSEGALRHGVLYDLIERADPSIDRRTRSVQWLVRKFAVDTTQAERVRQTALALFAQLCSGLPQADRLARKLGWAASLHEIGTRISHESSHKHGAYIVRHANITGFSVTELERLSLLVLGYKGKLKRLELALADGSFVIQLLCLRLAVILCHARSTPELRGTLLQREHHTITMVLPPEWETRYPQSRYLIDEECNHWKRSGLTWRLKTV